MKHRYVTKEILMACKKKPSGRNRDIHSQLEETIAERRKILPVWERLFLQSEPLVNMEIPAVKKDIHTQLAETIAEYKRIRKQSQGLFPETAGNSFLIREKMAA